MIHKSGIASSARLAAAVPDPAALPAEPPKAAGVLVQRGVLTKFQAQQLLQGRHKGFRLGPYVVLDHLGRGGMGVVYLAEHQELRRKVAVKVLVIEKGDDHQLASERFLREARAAAALDHPNIVRIFDVCRHGELPYLVMEHVDGESLQQILDRDGSFPFATAADAVAQAAAGLQHAHEKGFIHRDIKPGNLMRDRTGVVKILDMGLARAPAADEDRLTERLDAGAVVGTADFISPEQALNCPNIDIRADIYSLGATFFTLVAGKPPFEGNTTQKLLHHQVSPAPQLSALDPTLPKGLSAVVAKMLAKKPADRYQTPAEVIAALAPWLGNSTRVLAGLSRTNLGQGADLHAKLNEASASGRRLATAAAATAVAEEAVPVETGVVDPSAETGPVATAPTVRTPNQAPSEVAPALAARRTVRKKQLLIGGGVAAAVVAGVVVAVMAFGGGTPTRQDTVPPPGDVAQNPPAVVPDPDKKANPPTADPAPPPKKGGTDSASVAHTPPKPPEKKKDPPPPPQEKVLARLDLAAGNTFAVRTGLELRADNMRVTKVISQTGGEPPAGWKASVYRPESQVELSADAASPALVMRNLQGPGSAMLFMPRFECPSGVARLHLEYAAPVKDKGFKIRFKPSDNRSAWDVSYPPPTEGAAWRREDYVVSMDGAKGGTFEFHNLDPSPEAALKLRSVVVTEAPPGTPPTATPTTPAPTGPDYSKWTAGPVVYRLDLSTVPPFRNTKEGNKRVSGDAEKLPVGVKFGCWKSGATGEFRCETVDGAPALGVTNLNDERSGQFGFELERDMKLPLKAGTVYRVRVEYQARNEATGMIAVQSVDYKTLASNKVAATGDQWKTATVAFERKDGVPVRVTIDNTAVGEGNILLFRAVEVAELAKPN